MHRILTTVLLSTALAVPAASLLAQEGGQLQPVLGEWEMTMETPRGSMTQQFVFKLVDGALQGTVSSPQGSVDLKDVKFDNGHLTFVVERTFGQRSMTQSFSATIEGDEMKGTVSGGRGGERPFTARRKAT